MAVSAGGVVQYDVRYVRWAAYALALCGGFGLLFIVFLLMRDGMDTVRVRFPRVRFRTASGRDITFEAGMGRGGAAWHVGDTVPVRYRVDHPETAELDGFVALWGPTWPSHSWRLCSSVWVSARGWGSFRDELVRRVQCD